MKKTTLYNKKEIQSAAHAVLTTWSERQNNRQEAYINLQAGLRRAEMNQLADLLKQGVKETEEQTVPTVEEGQSTTKGPFTLRESE